MSWWENIYSFADGLSDNVGRMQTLLKDYIKDYALWGASHANNYFNILNHTWTDVRNLIDDKLSGYYSDVNDFYYVLTNKLENEYSILGKSWYNITSYVDNAISGFQSQINTLSNNASTLYSYAHTTLKNEINGLSNNASTLYSYAHTTLKNQIFGLSQDIDNINDSLNIVTRSALATVNYIAIESERRWGILKKSWTDITNLVNSNINSLKTDIIKPLSSEITTLGTDFDKLVNTTIKNIKTDIANTTSKLTTLTYDVVNPLKVDLISLTSKVNAFPSWITKTFEDIAIDFVEQFIKIFNASEDKSVRFLTALGIGAGEIITTILDTPKDMVAWIKNDIADVFENILDRVFK